MHILPGAVNLSSVETSLNLAIKRLVNSECDIAKYRILFLSEDNFHSPIKRLFTNEKWSIMESNWEKLKKGLRICFSRLMNT
ncbi:unnamed protein product [Rhizophagus irregularis]|nr:unnamed protein product [Rhizophagus irregularis]